MRRSSWGSRWFSDHRLFSEEEGTEGNEGNEDWPEMRIHTVADFCEGLGLPISAVPDVCEAFQQRELVQLAAAQARMQRCAGRPDHQALPLMDEGDEFGRVEARIPKEVFFNLMQRPGFGWEGLVSDEGMKDVLKAFPVCKVETVSGKIMTGYTGVKRTTVKRYVL